MAAIEESTLQPLSETELTVEDPWADVRDRARLSDVSGYDPDLAKEPASYGELYTAWDYGPYWGPGYSHPPAPHYPIP